MTTVTFFLLCAPLLAVYGWIMYTRGVSAGIHRGVDIGAAMSLEFMCDYIKENGINGVKEIMKAKEDLKDANL